MIAIILQTFVHEIQQAITGQIIPEINFISENNLTLILHNILVL
jgi:hypothetical protein